MQLIRKLTNLARLTIIHSHSFALTATHCLLVNECEMIHGNCYQVFECCGICLDHNFLHPLQPILWYGREGENGSVAPNECMPRPVACGRRGVSVWLLNVACRDSWMLNVECCTLFAACLLLLLMACWPVGDMLLPTRPPSLLPAEH